MKILLASHYGMCFGVRDALRATHRAAQAEPITVLGQLVHNPVVETHLRTLGVQRGELSDAFAGTRRVVITAHGAADREREVWSTAGFQVTDTTCPLVRKAHDALGSLVAAGYFPVVIGEAQHAEVSGLTGDFPEAAVILSEADVERLPARSRFGLISQTTQPLALALTLVEAVKKHHPGAEVRFMDTICHPTKQRQQALTDLCRQCELVIVVGGRNSNNTRQLVLTAQALGARAQQVEHAGDLNPEWFRRVKSVGVTAGTSTLDETVQAVVDRLGKISQQ